VRHSNSLPSNSKEPIDEQPLQNYVTSNAHCIMSLLTQQPCIDIDPMTLQQKRIHLHPYIREQLAQHAAWSQPQPKKGALYHQDALRS
jgi:hypothetical protein